MYGLFQLHHDKTPVAHSMNRNPTELSSSQSQQGGIRTEERGSVPGFDKNITQSLSKESRAGEDKLSSQLKKSDTHRESDIGSSSTMTDKENKQDETSGDSGNVKNSMKDQVVVAFIKTFEDEEGPLPTNIKQHMSRLADVLINHEYTKVNPVAAAVDLATNLLQSKMVTGKPDLSHIENIDEAQVEKDINDAYEHLIHHRVTERLLHANDRKADCCSCGEQGRTCPIHMTDLYLEQLRARLTKDATFWRHSVEKMNMHPGLYTTAELVDMLVDIMRRDILQRKELEMIQDNAPNPQQHGPAQAVRVNLQDPGHKKIIDEVTQEVQEGVMNGSILVLSPSNYMSDSDVKLSLNQFAEIAKQKQGTQQAQQ